MSVQPVNELRLVDWEPSDWSVSVEGEVAKGEEGMELKSEINSQMLCDWSVTVD